MGHRLFCHRSQHVHQLIDRGLVYHARYRARAGGRGRSKNDPRPAIGSRMRCAGGIEASGRPATARLATLDGLRVHLR